MSWYSSLFKDCNSVFEFVSSTVLCVCFTPWLSLFFFLFNHGDLSHFSWNRPASPFIRSWMWCLNRRRGTDWERHTTASKQSISSSGWHSGPLDKLCCCFSSASARLCCSGVSLQRRKALWPPPLRALMPGVHPMKMGRSFNKITHLQRFLRETEGQGEEFVPKNVHILLSLPRCLPCNELAVTLNI